MPAARGRISCAPSLPPFCNFFWLEFSQVLGMLSYVLWFYMCNYAIVSKKIQLFWGHFPLPDLKTSLCWPVFPLWSLLYTHEKTMQKICIFWLPVTLTAQMLSKSPNSTANPWASASITGQELPRGAVSTWLPSTGTLSACSGLLHLPPFRPVCPQMPV